MRFANLGRRTAERNGLFGIEPDFQKEAMGDVSHIRTIIAKLGCESV